MGRKKKNEGGRGEEIGEEWREERNKVGRFEVEEGVNGISRNCMNFKISMYRNIWKNFYLCCNGRSWMF